MPFIISITTRTRCKRLLCCLLAALLLPCGAMAEMLTDVGVHIGIISVATTQLNPLTPVEREFMSLTDLMYEGLMYLDDDYQPQPCLAERYSASQDGKSWFFYLREGVSFHDGTALSAYDVAATANEILRLAQDGLGRYQSLKYFITSIEATDSDGNRFFRLSNIEFGTGSMTATLTFYDLNKTYEVILARYI